MPEYNGGTQVFLLRQVSNPKLNGQILELTLQLATMHPLHSWNRTMRQTPVTGNYRLAAIPRMNRLIVYSRSSHLLYIFRHARQVHIRLTGMSKNI